MPKPLLPAIGPTELSTQVVAGLAGAISVSWTSCDSSEQAGAASMPGAAISPVYESMNVVRPLPQHKCHI